MDYSNIVTFCCCCVFPAPVAAVGGLVLSRPGRPALHSVLPAARPRRPAQGPHPAAGGSGQQAAGPHHQPSNGQTPLHVDTQPCGVNGISKSLLLFLVPLQCFTILPFQALSAARSHFLNDISGNATLSFLEPSPSTSALAETLTQACFSSPECQDCLVAVHQRRLTVSCTWGRASDLFPPRSFPLT